MNVTLGFSPCPNDTFIFDALVNGKIDTKGITFSAVLDDVETLNRWAAAGKLDITKLSFPALFQNSSTYQLLQAGAALGMGVGPLLIAKKDLDLSKMASYTIAIPGVRTTANFLLTHAFPEACNRLPMLFSDIEAAVLDERVDMGVIIHENRFTYQQKGLLKMCDLGDVWEQKQHAAIPLGGIAAKRSLPAGTIDTITQLIKKSLAYSYQTYPTLSNYVKNNAQEMDEEVMRKHINLYVNEYTLDLGVGGNAAVQKLEAIYNATAEARV